jgi:hypothetical protein
VTALDLEEIQPDVSIADLERRWGISRNALKARAKALGIELQRKGPTLTVWPGNQVADGDRLDSHCKAGGSLASFPGAVSVTPQASSDSSQLAVTTGLSLTPQDGSQLALLAAAVAAAMPTAPVDPLRRAKALAEAAELGVALSSLELAELVGMSPATVAGWPTGHQPRPGFKLLRCKQKPGGAVWWMVEREGDTTPMKSLSAVGASRTVGFGSCLTVEAVALPYF